MEPKIIFISTPLNQAFAEVIAQVVSPYGKLEVRTWQDKPDLGHYALIFLDAGILADEERLTDITDLLQRIFTEHKNAKVVVTTASPTWKRTRAALMAGAIDYIRQTLDANSLNNVLYPTLRKHLLENAEDGE